MSEETDATVRRTDPRVNDRDTAISERSEHKQQIDRIVEQLQAEPGDGYVFG